MTLQTILELSGPDRNGLPSDENDVLLADDLLQTRDDAFGLSEAQLRRFDFVGVSSPLHVLRTRNRRSLGERACGVEVDPKAVGRKREEGVLALELRFGRLPGPQRLLIGAASLLLFREALLGIEIFCMHVRHLSEG